MSKRFILTLATLLIIGGVAAVAVFLTKGYTFSPKEGRIVGTGIVSVTSLPDGASVYIDGHLTTATNTNISSLVPKTYKIRITKEGFIPWEKEVEVLEGLVTEVKATLFPSLPTIYPLTWSGVENPILSPDGEKLAFAVPFINDGHSRQKGGIWVWTMTPQPISFARGGQPQQVIFSSKELDFTQATLKWSPDSKSLLVTLQEGGVAGETNERNYLLSTDKLTQASDLRDLTPTIAANLKEWDEEQKLKEKARWELITDLKMKKIASASATTNNEPSATNQIKWAPDETKFIVISSLQTTANSIQLTANDSKPASPAKRGEQSAVNSKLSAKVYDFSSREEYALPEALNYFWLPDSKHVILVGEDKISIVELDGSNVSEIYAGKVEENLVFSWPDSSRLVILTSFNTATASKPNLFGLNLK